ncbi:zinc-binding alcohol dehydrogenase family protein [Myroides albus]|uniref:Zinc-binding dehydrogenase n=1 Tax=Myroides albus TaxID=2562892 RepID=A0A6I3LJP1_9FLAO|nr:zinc-binding alcohol dehydrogenase family protein [Myroides albus]MTG97420.1 zinc-binding dehydrogenase [Myroides albus]UVD79449.1 zinc-binding alcohol dehydrogenase family protein [Myroides albus]
MKAVIVEEKGKTPTYTPNFKSSKAIAKNAVLMRVKAVAIKNLDRAIASGKHYSVSTKSFNPFVIGTDAVGELEDGRLVYGFGIQGTLSEYAYVDKNQIVPLPKGMNIALAAALPNALMGSVIALMLRAKLKKSEVVLINGATGVTGQVAVQMAKYYGASKVFVTGRNADALKKLEHYGADQLISLTQSSEELSQQIHKLNQEFPIDIVIDYLWGESASVILNTLKDKGAYQHHTRFVNVGAMSGDDLQLSSSILRGTDLVLLGSGLGSWPQDDIDLFFRELLPEAFNLACEKKLFLDTISYNWKEVTQVWNQSLKSNVRLVFEVA